MKSLVQTFFLFAVLIAGIELFWSSSSPDQRVRWLQLIPAPGLADIVETKQTRPVLPQLMAIIANPGQSMVTSPQANDPSDLTITDATAVADKQVSPFGHFVHRQQRCIKPPTQKISEVDPQAIYRWTDANGRVHFGDKAKNGSQAKDMSKTYGRRTQGVKLSLEYPGWDGDTTLASALQKEASLMYRILTKYIPRSEWRQINLNLVIFPGQQAFEDYKHQQKANAGWMAYYDGRKNQAYFARQQSAELTMRLARHEMTHAMMLGMLGTTPIWISEGIAQYLERLRWQMSSAQVDADQLAYQQLSEAGVAGFVQVAGMEHQEFNGYSQDENYGRASAMVHFMLGHRDGQYWMKETLGYFAINPCGQYDVGRFFNQAYPGGLAGVSRKYQQWLQSGKFKAHYY